MKTCSTQDTSSKIEWQFCQAKLHWRKDCIYKACNAEGKAGDVPRFASSNGQLEATDHGALPIDQKLLRKASYLNDLDVQTRAAWA